jgi:hypothetical protein
VCHAGPVGDLVDADAPVDLGLLADREAVGVDEGGLDAAAAKGRRENVVVVTVALDQRDARQGGQGDALLRLDVAREESDGERFVLGQFAHHGGVLHPGAAEDEDGLGLDARHD